MIGTPELDGEIVRLAGHELTPEDADRLARDLDRAARDAAGARYARRAREEAEATWARESARSGWIPCRVSGQDALLDLRGPHALTRAGGRWRAISVADVELAAPILVRVFGGRVLHVWSGGARARCGASMHPQLTFGDAGQYPLCSRCGPMETP